MNKSLKTISLASAIGIAAALAGCAAPDPYGPNNYPVSSANPYPGTYANTYPYNNTVQVATVEYGRVTNVQLIAGAPVANPNRAAAGSVIGAVVGGLLGNQIGHGSGRAAATVLGAVGGAAVGNNIAQNTQPSYNTAGPVYRITVQTDSGMLRTYDVNTTADLRPGDRVRIDNGMIYLG